MFRIRLKALREDKNMSQQEFAAAIGVAQSAVGNWESGTRKPRTTAQLEKIADFFGVSVDYLLGRDEEKKEPTVKDNGLSEAEWALIKIFRQIPPDEQNRVVRIVQAASDSLRQPPTLPSEGQ